MSSEEGSLFPSIWEITFHDIYTVDVWCLIFHFMFGKFSNLQKRQKYEGRHTRALHPPGPLLIIYSVCLIIHVLALISFNVYAYIIRNKFLPDHPGT